MQTLPTQLEASLYTQTATSEWAYLDTQATGSQVPKQCVDTTTGAIPKCSREEQGYPGWLFPTEYRQSLLRSGKRPMGFNCITPSCASHTPLRGKASQLLATRLVAGARRTVMGHRHGMLWGENTYTPLHTHKKKHKTRDLQNLHLLLSNPRNLAIKWCLTDKLLGRIKTAQQDQQISTQDDLPWVNHFLWKKDCARCKDIHPKWEANISNSSWLGHLSVCLKRINKY